MRSTTSDVWKYTNEIDSSVSTNSVVGYGVEALDGSIGKVDDATYDVSGSFIIVDTGPWIFGKKVMLPAGVIRDVNHDDETILVHRTKDEIKNSPEYDERMLDNEEYRGRLGSYYGQGGTGYRDWDDTLL